MSRHDWELFDFARKARCKICGMVANAGGPALFGVCIGQPREIPPFPPALQRAKDEASEWRAIATSRQAALDAAAKRIAALEAECESLSRQLRSREINAEPVVTRPAWRWSPLL